MILATYQKTNFSGRDTTESIPYPQLQQVLGFNPVFCFPANTIQQCVVESILSKPNRPEQLIIFESENYQMINAGEWEKCVKKENYVPDPGFVKTNILTSEPSDRNREYLVEAIPEDSIIAKIDLFRVMIYDENAMYTKRPRVRIAMDENGFESYRGFVGLCYDFLTKFMRQQILANYKPVVLFPGTGKITERDRPAYYEESELTFLRLRMAKRWFETFYMSCLLSQVDVYNDETVACIYDVCMFDFFSFWKDGDKTNIEPDTSAVYDNLLKMISHNFLEYIVGKTNKFQRNGLCPCGSELKYKKCHGKTVILSSPLQVPKYHAGLLDILD